MIGAFIPDAVMNFLQGVDFWLFNFSFISLPKSGLYGEFVSFFDWNSSDSYLSSIGLDSVWMIINQVKLFAIFLVLLTLHIPVLILFKKYRTNTNWCGKLVGFIYMFFTFTIYIRTIIESTLVVLLTSFNEFYVHDLSSGSKILSFSISIVLVLCLMGFWIGTYFVSKSAADPEYDAEATYLNEVVEGTKTSFIGRLLIFTAITRVILSVSWVIFAQSLGMIARISIFVGIQVIFMIITIVVRHFKNISDNIIQILNDSIYLFAWIALFRYNTETNWADGYITALFATITINGLIITLIQVVMLIKALWDLRSKKQKVINATKITGK